MAPRIQSRRVSSTLLPYLGPSLSTSIPSLPSLPSVFSTFSRSFSATAPSQSKLRREMFEWLDGPGSELKHHKPNRTNYVSQYRKMIGKEYRDLKQYPFPENPTFISQSILSLPLQNEIYKRVVEEKQTVREVSVTFGVDMRRIAAVVRLVELEKRQRSQGKPLALPYARAIHEMVPTTGIARNPDQQKMHESINDLPMHPLTGAQMFYPVPESRSFTRVDAGRVFSGAPAQEHKIAEKWSSPHHVAERVPKRPHLIELVGKGDNARQVLQPADARIPHPQLIALERDLAKYPDEPLLVEQRHQDRLRDQAEAEQKQREAAQARRERKITSVSPQESRFDYRIKEVAFTTQTTGRDGRAPWAPGRRYGVPSDDRKRGMRKVPTRVEA
ncbi:hypothetical protein NUU61_002234 [Penicillium alfredii]|uniref:Ribosomal protein S35, mitochondrial n=1 Tax=Penicillium alfredii TaxID=1506179 RepID=A0A9W9FRV8_9EURO|nr:uncharacterized protein NUU61_002234 [Penicillium alfredii]KAJ5104887.1 hypothetical protein NUU61_002234 [Penicillium alfredii]